MRTMESKLGCRSDRILARIGSELRARLAVEACTPLPCELQRLVDALSRKLRPGMPDKAQG